jgi:hypothetical protein
MLEIYVIDSVKVIGNKRVIKRFPQGRGGGGTRLCGRRKGE